MRIRGMGRVRQAARWFASRAIILVYHRVADLLSPDPFLLCVTPQHFLEHLEILRKHGELMQLQQLARALRNRDLPRRAVAITFDDGYANNLCHAKPLLERCDAHATVFVASGYVGEQREFWWDELERLLLQPGTLPKMLRLTINGRQFERQLGDAVNYSEEEYSRHCSWDIRQDDPSLRQGLYRSLYQLLRPLADRERRQILDDLRTWAGAEPLTRGTHRALSPNEVIELAAGGLVEIGAHTVTHPALAELPTAAQRSEIEGSKTTLEKILGHTVTSFAYPYGSPRHYTSETTAIVKEAGFGSACSGAAGLVWRGADLFQLPRFSMRDWDGETFEIRLQEWLRN